MAYRTNLVIFDCDGVLVDSEMIASRVFADHLSKHGYPCTEAESREKFTGWSLTSATAHVEREMGTSLPSDFLATLAVKDKAAFEEHLKPIPGIRETLNALDVPFCVASSGEPWKIRNSLRLCNILNFFDDRMFSADQVAHGKPAPDLFLFAADRMNTTAEQCLVVEDSIAGVQAGVAAGMRVLGFAGGAHCGTDHAERLMKCGAHQVFSEMRTLLAIINDNT